MNHEQVLESDNPSADFRYYYRDGMPLRRRPKPLTDAPAWGHMRHLVFDRWHEVRDDWSYDTPQTRLLDDHMWQSDELMDRVVEMFRREGSVQARAKFRDALENGIETVEDPAPELVELFAQVDSLPEWYDPVAAERGRIALCNVTSAAQSLALNFGVFATSMETRTSAAVGATNMLVSRPIQRNVESSQFFTEITYSDVHDRRSPGFRSILNVRLVHAQANRGLMKKWGDGHFNDFGMPISSSFLLGGEGWFALMPLAADEILGRPQPDHVWDDVAMHWAHILYLFGVEERLIPRTGAEMRTMADYIFAHAGVPNQYRQEVAGAVIGALSSASPKFAGAMLGGVTWLMGQREVEALVEGTQWEASDLNYMASVWHAAARGEVLTAALRDEIPELRTERVEIAKQGNPHMSALLEYAKMASEQAEVPTDFSGHDDALEGSRFGVAAAGAR
ncbi:oxygenase MpaB family protein [Leucobacter luti]|uniref:oxygenase MpaB family protein n=1 Tax=Leucobacter luti TaxID=340320 RepID=UPI003D04441C